MGELTYDQLSDRLARGGLGGDYFIKTEDPFLRDEAIALLVDAHLGENPSDFDLDQLSGDAVDAEELASRIDTPPLLAPHRVVVLRRAQALSSAARTSLEQAVERPVAGRVLIISAEIPKGSKAKFYGVLSKHCTVVAARVPRGSELPGWLARRARSVHGVELEMPAAQLLVAGIGPHLGVLDQELEKLVTYVAPEKRIGLEEVRSAVGALPQVDRWKWVDSVLDRKITRALNELPALLDSGESAVGLIGALGEALIRAGLAREGENVLADVLKRDGGYGNIAWKVRTYARQGRRWSGGTIAHALEELLRADRLIKSGGLSNRAALEEALLRIGTRADGGADEIKGGL
jgi:DNA polymerase-3 subunit delta